MNRFEIVKRTAEVKWNDRFNIIPGCTEHDEEPEVIETFDNLGAAIKELYQYKTKINEFSASTGTMYQVTEYAVQEICGDQILMMIKKRKLFQEDILSLQMIT